MRSWVYGATYGAAASAIILVTASVLIPRSQIVSDEPPAAQINSEDLAATASAESKPVALSTADTETAAVQPAVRKPAEPATEAKFNGLELNLSTPEIAELKLEPKEPPVSEAAPRPLTRGDSMTILAVFVRPGLPAEDLRPAVDLTKPPYYGAPLVQPAATLVTPVEPVAPAAVPEPLPANTTETTPPVTAATMPVDDQLAETGIIKVDPNSGLTTSGGTLPSASGGLPQIGVTPPVVDPATGVPADGSPSSALLANASVWTDAGTPKIAILLIGTTPDFTLPNLTDMPLAVVVDAMSDAADTEIATIRGAGQEVVIATPLPAGATASDVQVSFETYKPRLASSVAFIEAETGAFSARPVAEAVVDLAATGGFGVISTAQGLNAVKQLATPAGAHAGLIEEDLSSSAGDKAALLRALDKAAFKAGQEGSVILLAPATAEVIAALSEWQGSPRGKTVALAPISAVLKSQ